MYYYMNVKQFVLFRRCGLNFEIPNAKLVMLPSDLNCSEKRKRD